MPVEPPARPDLATSLTAILPRIEALHAERAALSMQRLLENGGKPHPSITLENLILDMKENLVLNGLSHTPALATLQSHVLDILFNHLIEQALDTQLKQELIKIALRCQKQCTDSVRELHKLERTIVRLANEKPKKKQQSDYYQSQDFR